MKPTTAIHLISVAVTASAITLWAATGSEGYTRWPNSKLAATDAPDSELENDLFDEIGLVSHEDRAAAPDIDSRFALGLLPGGFTPEYLPSVATSISFSLALSASTAVFFPRRKPRNSNQDSSSTVRNQGNERIQ